MLTKRDLETQREALQDDLITQLDGLPQGYIDQVCEAVVERFGILITKLKEVKSIDHDDEPSEEKLVGHCEIVSTLYLERILAENRQLKTNWTSAVDIVEKWIPMGLHNAPQSYQQEAKQKIIRDLERLSKI